MLAIGKDVNVCDEQKKEKDLAYIRSVSQHDRERMASILTQRRRWLSCLAGVGVRISRRSVWVKFRNVEWWRDVERGNYGEEWWKANFRVNRDTFRLLCNELKPYIQRKVGVREPISVEKRVAVTLYKLATNTEYRTLSNLFGIGKSTVCQIVLETCQVVANKLLSKYVKIPCGELLKEVVSGFESLWGFPQAVGAIDGTHIPIIKPQESASDYYNRKGYYSVIMQALVDHRGRFMDICVGWPGKVHDVRVFGNSSMYKKASSGQLFQNMNRKLCGVDVPLVVLGDPAYPLLPWLMKPYLENEHTPVDKKMFNYRQSRARMVVENSFGRLKGRWRCLLKQMDFKLENVPAIVATCVVLHNMCEMFGDTCYEDWTHDTVTHDNTQLLATACNTSTPPSTAVLVRDTIKDFIASQ